jgi:hypothetical protein
MFHEQLIDVARRKERLIAQCEGQRLLVAQALRRWEEPARAIDRAWSVVHFFRLHPVALAVAVAAAMVLGRRHLFKWAGRGLFMWRAWRTLTTWLRRYGV